MRIPKLISAPFLILPWLAVLVILSWIILARFPPSGIFTTASVMDGRSPFINPFLPSERATVPGQQEDGWTGQRITGDPTYFTARVPGPYELVKVQLEYRVLRQTLVEFGIMRGETMDLMPMYSSELQADEWVRTRTGFARNEKTTENKNVNAVTWYATSTMPELQDGEHEPIETKVSLRGAHDFYFVPADGHLDVAFIWQDVNRKRGNTTAVFRLFHGDEELQREVLGTSGSRDTKMGLVTEQKIDLKNASPGVYRISFQADDEVFIRSIITTSQRWVVGPRLNFGDVVGFSEEIFPGRAWTDSRHLVAETFHNEGLQTITFGSLMTKIQRTHETYRLDRVDENVQPVELFAAKGDMRFIGDGWFALRPEAYFVPKPKRFSAGTELDKEGVRTVLTDYQKPTVLSDGWLQSTFEYEIEPQVDGLRFVLSSPGIASRMGAVDIRKISIRYTRPIQGWSDWWKIVKHELANAWRRL